MAKNDFVKTTAADSYPLGNARENKDASVYTGFKYPSGGGNDIGVYKQPMNSPESSDIAFKQNPNTFKGIEVGPETVAMNVSIGDRGANRTEKEGVVTRGNGAATKGTKARGPMA
jgi:hypothetical protein